MTTSAATSRGTIAGMIETIAGRNTVPKLRKPEAVSITEAQATVSACSTSTTTTVAT